MLMKHEQRHIVVHPDRVLVKTSMDNSHWQTGEMLRGLCMASAFLGKYASIIAVDLIQQKKLNFWNFYESNLTEARFEFI